MKDLHLISAHPSQSLSWHTTYIAHPPYTADCCIPLLMSQSRDARSVISQLGSGEWGVSLNQFICQSAADRNWKRLIAPPPFPLTWDKKNSTTDHRGPFLALMWTQMISHFCRTWRGFFFNFFSCQVNKQLNLSQEDCGGRRKWTEHIEPLYRLPKEEAKSGHCGACYLESSLFCLFILRFPLSPFILQSLPPLYSMVLSLYPVVHHLHSKVFLPISLRRGILSPFHHLVSSNSPSCSFIPTFYYVVSSPTFTMQSPISSLSCVLSLLFLLCGVLSLLSHAVSFPMSKRGVLSFSFASCDVHSLLHPLVNSSLKSGGLHSSFNLKSSLTFYPVVSSPISIIFFFSFSILLSLLSSNSVVFTPSTIL